MESSTAQRTGHVLRRDVACVRDALSRSRLSAMGACPWAAICRLACGWGSEVVLSGTIGGASIVIRGVRARAGWLSREAGGQRAGGLLLSLLVWFFELWGSEGWRGASLSLNPIGGACMKQGRLGSGRENRRGSEKGRGWLTLIRETAFGEEVARGMPNLRRGVVVSTDPGSRAR